MTMPYRTDDLIPLLSRRDEGGSMQYAQGKLLAFNPVTLDNEVAFRGTVVRNLNVSAAAVDAAVWQPGDLLELRGYAPRRGPSVWWIGSRILTPGPGAAKQLTAATAAIIADRIFSVDEDSEVQISHTSFSFVSATGGPTLTGVPVTPAGRAIVFASANLGTDTAAAGTSVRGFMSYEVTGASTVAPVTRNAVQLDFRNDVDDNGIGISASRASLLTGLNEGLHNFEAKYQVTAFGVGDEAIFLFRNLTVIAF